MPQIIRINGARLRRGREEAHISQDDFAPLVHVSLRTFRNAETKGTIDDRVADAICKLLHKPKEELLRLSPDLQVAFLDGRSREQEDLLESALDCHRRLFTDYFAEVSRKNTRQWLVEDYIHDRWREIYAVAYDDQEGPRSVVALASFSGHLDGKFWNCTRIGVLPECRNGLVAQKLLTDAVKKKAELLLPKARSFVGEVEAPDLILLAELKRHIAKGRILKSWRDKARMRQALRAARRLEFFGWIHALVATTPSGSPLTITSPAWREPLDSSNERETMLLIHPFDSNLSTPVPSVAGTLDFIYGVLYADSFGGGPTSVELEGYRPYVTSLLARMKTRAEGSSWGPLPRYDDVITQAKKEGLWDEIALVEAEK